MRDKMLLGLTHVDLGWLKGRDEMAQILDAYLVRLFDLIEGNPDFHYLLEQGFITAI